jgi:hypothetical protein
MTTITIDRALLEQALEALDNIPHPPWRDKELANAIRAELAKPEQEESFIPNWANYRQGVADGKAGSPKWHDAPTEPGIWLCDEGGPDCYTYTAHNIVLLNDPALKDDECRWYGPIPQGGAKAEGGAG